MSGIGSAGTSPGAQAPKSPTIERLRKRPDFLAAAEGRRFHTERMTAQGRLRDAAEGVPAIAGLRLGFTVTKRVGHATERNRIRRRLREAVKAVAADLPTVPADIVLIARRPALQAGFETLKDDLRRAVPAAIRPRGPGDAGRDGAGRSRRGGSRGSGPKAPGGGGPTPTPSRRDAGPPAAPSATPNACGGVPDGQ